METSSSSQANNTADSEKYQIVKLNIGGVQYQTTKGTLCNGKENFFTGLLSGKIPRLNNQMQL